MGGAERGQSPWARDPSGHTGPCAESFVPCGRHLESLNFILEFVFLMRGPCHPWTQAPGV